jgi:hypothetical protein
VYYPQSTIITFANMRSYFVLILLASAAVAAPIPATPGGSDPATADPSYPRTPGGRLEVTRTASGGYDVLGAPANARIEGRPEDEEKRTRNVRHLLGS